MSSLSRPAAALAVALFSAAPLFAGGVSWEKSFEKALRRAQKERKPIMIDFRAEWCGWCHRLDKTTYRDEKVERLVGEFFVAVKVDTEGSPSEREIASRYDVMSLPTILFVSPTGRVVHRLDGFQGPGQFPETLETARGFASKVMSYEEILERKADDALALFGLGSHLFERQLYEESREVLERAVQLDGTSPVSYRKRARMMVAIIASADRQFEEADSRLREALGLGLSSEYDPRILYVEAKNFIAWGRPGQARPILQRILVDHPASSIAERARETLQALNR